MRYNKGVMKVLISPFINKALFNKGDVNEERGYNNDVKIIYYFLLNAE